MKRQRWRWQPLRLRSRKRAPRRRGDSRGYNPGDSEVRCVESRRTMVDEVGEPTPYVFLSYTSADRERVLALADRLEEAGVRVWVDRRDLVGGSSWDASIVDAISRCTVFALTCSAASLGSPNV